MYNILLFPRKVKRGRGMEAAETQKVPCAAGNRSSGAIAGEIAYGPATPPALEKRFAVGAGCATLPETTSQGPIPTTHNKSYRTAR